MHIKRYGGVLVIDPPAARTSGEAHRCAHPETNRLSGRLWSSAKPVEAMTEGEVAAHRNTEIARLGVNRPFPGIEPSLLLLEIHSTMRKRRRQIEYGCVLRIRRSNGGGILVVMRLVDTFDQRPDIGFICQRVHGR